MFWQSEDGDLALMGNSLFADGVEYALSEVEKEELATQLSDGWIPHTTPGVCPCDEGEFVDVKTSNGTVGSGPAWHYSWSSAFTHWRLTTPN